jgi:hypothetical protein
MHYEMKQRKILPLLSIIKKSIMKVKNIYKYLFAALLTLQLIACDNSTDAEQKFDQTPTERLNAQKTELNKALLSSEFGWKAVYFTDNTVLGGFTHLFKFANDGSVQMASDFDSDTDVYKSEYDIQLGSTVSLVFTTKNRIHLLSESDNYPIDALESKGYLGDFQFLYYGQENGDIVFRTNRKVQELRFVKATAQDWVDLPKNITMIPNVIGKNKTSLYRGLETNDGKTKQTFDFNPFSDITRFTTISNSTGIFDMGIGYAPNGIVVSPPVVVGDQKLTNFIFNETDGSFTATGTNGVTASIKYSDTPFVLTEDYKVMLQKPTTGYGYISPNIVNAATNSVFFKKLVSEINAALPATQKVSRIDFTFNDVNGDSYVIYRFTGGKTLIYQNITLKEDAANKTLKLTTTSWESNTGLTIPEPALLKNFAAELVNPAGLYVKKESFTVGAPNAIFTFASAANSGFRMTTYAFQ